MFFYCFRLVRQPIGFGTRWPAIWTFPDWLWRQPNRPMRVRSPDQMDDGLVEGPRQWVALSALEKRAAFFVTTWFASLYLEFSADDDDDWPIWHQIILRLANWEAASTICYTVYCIQYLLASYLNRTDTTAIQHTRTFRRISSTIFATTMPFKKNVEPEAKRCSMVIF
jgi:hypothetical protein